ncbi:glutathione S-transferase isoform X2 [Anopheles merus]|uniref:Isoform B of Glutathione S-transferase n=5 Tax=gambiae species complex TaxID=44542 RepID=P46428-2|nr:glutathione S-transferase isoform X2 [Anopheles merus]XP_041782271.1 glutathione S-transferase isoform X2 [Anopheles merus]
MPDYKVYYFNVKALGEPLRFLLSYGNLPFDDVRITREEWPALKPTMPMGQMPVLEVDGKRVHQSLAMCRYVAKQINLAGDNPLEALQIDAIVDTINDFRLKIAIVAYEPDDMVKEKKMVTLNNEVIPFYLTKLNVIAKENNGHLVLGKPTWADVYFAGILDYLNYLTKTNLLENFPNLQEVVQKVLDNENVKAYIAKRPITEV